MKTFLTILAATLALAPPGRTQDEAPAAATPAQPASPVVMLRMRNGAIHWGRIDGHDPETVHFVRLDNGGVASVPWGMLDPVQERELRLKFGYVDVTDDEILVEADRLVLRGGEEKIGKIVGRTDDAILLKTNTAVIEVPKTRIAAPSTTVQVPALDIYTREELYSQHRIATVADDPKSVFELAQFCERILDYAHAAEHYAVVAELDPNFRPDDVKVALERSRTKAESQEQIDYLADIERKRKRKQYDKAMEMVDAFPAMFPDSPLLDDLQKRRLRIQRSVERDLRDEVREKWISWAYRIARSQARSGATWEETVSYIEDKMSEDILAKVTEDLKKVTEDVEPDDVRLLWSQREGGRWKTATYGVGTWLLGEDRALAGGKGAEEKKEEEKGEKQSQRDSLADKLDRYMKHQEMVRKAKQAQDDAVDFEDFWQHMPSKAQWILAYYAEFGGDMVVDEKPLFRNCSECGGKGVIEILALGGAKTGGTGSGSTLVKCPLCQHIGVVRRVHYR